MCGLYVLVGLNNALCIVKVDTQKVRGYFTLFESRLFTDSVYVSKHEKKCPSTFVNRETMDGVDCIDLDFSL